MNETTDKYDPLAGKFRIHSNAREAAARSSTEDERELVNVVKEVNAVFNSTLVIHNPATVLHLLTDTFISNVFVVNLHGIANVLKSEGDTFRGHMEQILSYNDHMEYTELKHHEIQHHGGPYP
jgi:hypothetical protein